MRGSRAPNKRFQRTARRAERDRGDFGTGTGATPIPPGRGAAAEPRALGARCADPGGTDRSSAGNPDPPYQKNASRGYSNII